MRAHYCTIQVWNWGWRRNVRTWYLICQVLSTDENVSTESFRISQLFSELMNGVILTFYLFQIILFHLMFFSHQFNILFLFESFLFKLLLCQSRLVVIDDRLWPVR
eukprot:Lithocolla_globosa_v1_NODE_534_length_3801_cov_4.912974.p3 type:complete len:106 gc:universal NODE_534_length_3801_cov_4.912974:3198-2881(-)